MTLPNEDGRAASAAKHDQGVDLVRLLIILGEGKRLIAAIAGVALLVALAIALASTPIFTARTTLMPPQQQGNSLLAGSLGALAATAGLSTGVKTSDEFYAGLLRTDLISDVMISAHKLQERYKTSSLVDTRRALAQKVRIVTDRKSGLITVEVDDTDPAFAARLANSYPEELTKLLTQVEVTAAQQRRRFYEMQMKKVKDELVAAEVAVKLAQEKGGVMSLDAQTQGAITSAAQLRAQIVAREVQLQAMRSYAGPQNPDYSRINAELLSLRGQLEKIEGPEPAPAASAARRENVNEALTNVRAFRELKYQEAMYSALLQQFQLAKAEESKEAPLVQQIGTATPPDRKSKPSRALIVLAGLVAGLMLGCLAALLRHVRRVVRTDEFASSKWRAMSAAWSLRN
jgi:tyrosine-protein kinase Etk/Wzc